MKEKPLTVSSGAMPVVLTDVESALPLLRPGIDEEIFAFGPTTKRVDLPHVLCGIGDAPNQTGGPSFDVPGKLRGSA